MTHEGSRDLPRLSGLTPARGLDRDAVVFEAGRRSARAGRPWKLACALLVAGHAAWAGVWLGASRSPPAVTDPVPVSVTPVAEWEPGPSRRLELPPLPPADPDPTPPGPALTAGAGRRDPSIWN